LIRGRTRVLAVAAGAVLVAGATLLGGSPAGAIGAPKPDIVIDFEQDTTGAKPNGFTSVDSAQVHFEDTIGANLSVTNFTTGKSDGNALISPGTADSSGIRIQLDRPTTRISMAFGNDDPAFTSAGDEVLMRTFRGGTFVGEARVVMNRNDLMDQTISFGNGDGPLFNRATVLYEVSSPPSAGVSEIIDNISIAPLCTVAGDENANTLNGTTGDDVICGGGGNDTIRADAGADQVVAGRGVDNVNGGAGDDFLAGNSGGDTISGGADDDRIEGGKGNDVLSGKAGDDVLKGGQGTDTCSGGLDTDTAGACENLSGVP
jgi:hypothetical protein